MGKLTKPYQYGKSPNPTNWQEAADALNTLTKPKHKPNAFAEKFTNKLDSIEQLLKDHK